MQREPNRLAGATSPYLLQHQFNPVDWFPWCDEAFEKARREDKPIFLSIGYSACHWCHVMEHESFENEALAKILNDEFVSIKVDREQRPDLDQIYMQVVQMLTGSGGWPMSVFMTPDAKPFYGGTYWPPENRWGRPGFGNVLESVIDAWKNRRPSLLEQSDLIISHLNQAISSRSKPKDSVAHVLDADVVHQLFLRADRGLINAFDAKHGGFGSAPKFPQASELALLMSLQSREPSDDRFSAITRTLDAMADGGIYDHLGGGFARYSVDDQWLVPHFEKMLYDNALLTSLYLDGYRMTKNRRYATVARETIEYVLRDLCDPTGGFYSSEDADSEGVEGKYYVWTRDEIIEALGLEDANWFCEAYGVTFAGNFEGKNILYRPEPFEQVADRFNADHDLFAAKIEQCKARLLEIRSQRVRPGLDDKVLVSWNALMISALANASHLLEEPRYLAAAQQAARFLLDHMRSEAGDLLHVWRKGLGEIRAFLDDYSFFIAALIDLWSCDGDHEWLEQADSLALQMIEQFAGPEGRFYYTSSKSEELITRTIDLHDTSVPSGNSMAAWSLAHLAHWTSKEVYQTRLHRLLESSAATLQNSVSSVGQLLRAMDFAYAKVETWLVLVRTEEDRIEVQRLLANDYAPHRRWLVLTVDEKGNPRPTNPLIASWLEGRTLPSGQRATLYPCQGQICDVPITGWESLLTHITE